ncbi:sensor histidine kinase [Clostridium uliginosum]|uniref:histidine kinase n=1 Tax=Clostridium uliginosum TaxID=119641 RepID=A0A1I1PZJ2_9CLOT|nr:HAMP domain-containing sensor histidine kinase [Clostridium uliginosum]SFD15314.1 Signal transduction histidine kinase [Clostridium uliginosum]
MEVALIFLITFIIFLFVVLYNVKRQIKNILSQIKEINSGDLNNISVSLVNNDVIELAAEINRIINTKDELRIEVLKSEKNLKESIANISHDFRTPLTSIIGYIQLLGRSKLDEKQRGYLEITQNKSYELKNLADDFFELSVLESSEVTPIFTRINVENLLSYVILENIKMIEDANLNLEVNISHKPVFIYADEAMLKRIMQNLISNAVKYSKKDFIITLEEKDQVRIKVKNSIDDEENIDTEKLFERFYKCDKARSKKGTGLGLAIVKLLTEKMNGTVSAIAIRGYLEIVINFKVIK